MTQPESKADVTVKKEENADVNNKVKEEEPPKEMTKDEERDIMNRVGLK